MSHKKMKPIIHIEPYLKTRIKDVRKLLSCSIVIETNLLFFVLLIQTEVDFRKEQVSG